MFFFPVSKWIGGVFFEHTHRLTASLVGFLTTLLALWLFGWKSRPVLRWVGGIFMVAGGVLCLFFPSHAAENLLLAAVGLAGLVAGFYWPRCEPAPKSLRILGVTAFAAVVTQGVLGGLRVTELNATLGIFHATLAQLFFLLLCAIALFQTDFWRRLPVREEADPHHFQLFFTVITGLILTQLMLGATMRHQHAGLAIPDFPAAYGKLWPDTDSAAIARYNQNRLEVLAYNPITAAQVELQMVHRILALLIFTGVSLCAWRARRLLGARHWLTRFAGAWFGLVLTQVFLGAATIWTNKSADVATAHVACGALCLATGGLASIVSFRLLAAPVARAKVGSARCADRTPQRGVPTSQDDRGARNGVTTLLNSSSMTAK
jgi:cytochrome c oxidase assembly protein subunit 15